MLKEQIKLLRYGMMAMDALLIGVAFWAAYHIRQVAPQFIPSLTRTGPITAYYWIVLATIPVWLTLLHQFKTYSYTSTGGFWFQFWQVSKTCVIGFVILSAIIYFLDREHYSRALLITYVATIWVFRLASRIIISAIQHWARRCGLMGFTSRNILLIGSHENAIQFVRLINQHRNWGLNLVGYLDGFRSENLEPYGVKRLGDTKDIARILEKNVIDEVLFAVSPDRLLSIESAIQKCEEIGIKVHITAKFFDNIASRTELEEFGGIPVLTLTRVPCHAIQLFTKRIIDIVVASTGLLLTLPVFAITALLIRITSKGPVFFRQTRCGLNGRNFTMYKFRTMCHDAEIKLMDVTHLNRMSGPVFKAADDPRITRVGRLLRKLSIDELPQLWNVLKGDMSLVGPRPPIPDEVEKYERWQRRRLSMRPGITCLWQVSGRNIVDFDEWMQLDLKYIDNWSLWLDVKLMLKTLPAVLSTAGAQ